MKVYQNKTGSYNYTIFVFSKSIYEVWWNKNDDFTFKQFKQLGDVNLGEYPIDIKDVEQQRIDKLLEKIKSSGDVCSLFELKKVMK